MVKKAAEQLEKLNNDCNMTAGLEAKLVLAIGERVMLRPESETRVNDYNPLLLLLWKANIDIQFIAESSLALAHYVSESAKQIHSHEKFLCLQTTVSTHVSIYYNHT